MNESKFFNDMQLKSSAVFMLPKMNTFYNELMASFQKYEIIDYYIKTEKFEGPGSILETLFFDAKLIHWLVLKSTSITHNIFPLNRVNSVFISVINDQKTLSHNDKPDNDKLQLIVTFLGMDLYKIYINDESSKFPELLLLKDSLLTQISSL